MNQVILQVLAFHLQSQAHGVPKEQAKPGKIHISIHAAKKELH